MIKNTKNETTSVVMGVGTPKGVIFRNVKATEVTKPLRIVKTPVRSFPALKWNSPNTRGKRHSSIVEDKTDNSTM